MHTENDNLPTPDAPAAAVETPSHAAVPSVTGKIRKALYALIITAVAAGGYWSMNRPKQDSTVEVSKATRFEHYPDGDILGIPLRYCDDKAGIECEATFFFEKNTLYIRIDGTDFSSSDKPEIYITQKVHKRSTDIVADLCTPSLKKEPSECSIPSTNVLLLAKAVRSGGGRVTVQEHMPYTLIIRGIPPLMKGMPPLVPDSVSGGTHLVTVKMKGRENEQEVQH